MSENFAPSPNTHTHPFDVLTESFARFSFRFSLLLTFMNLFHIQIRTEKPRNTVLNKFYQNHFVCHKIHLKHFHFIVSTIRMSALLLFVVQQTSVYRLICQPKKDFTPFSMNDFTSVHSKFPLLDGIFTLIKTKSHDCNSFAEQQREKSISTTGKQQNKFIQGYIKQFRRGKPREKK